MSMTDFERKLYQIFVNMRKEPDFARTKKKDREKRTGNT